MPRMLIVEDNADLAFGLRNTFEVEGFNVTVVGDGVEADRLLSEETFDIVVLDLKLPGMHGREVLRRLRARSDETSVLVLSALDKERDIVAGFRDGADDYVTKSLYSLPVLIERVRALLRRGSDAPRFGALRRVTRLTPREVEVAALVREGLSDKAIARRLGITLGTAKIHVHHILSKMALRRRRDLRPASPRPRRKI